MSVLNMPMMQAARVLKAQQEPFATTTSAQSAYDLTMHGKRVRQVLAFNALHQTDWQGRVELSSAARTNIVGDLTEHAADSGYGTFHSNFLTTANNIVEPATGLTLRQVNLSPSGGGNAQILNDLQGWPVQPGQTIYVRYIIQPGSMTYTQVGCYGTGVGTTFRATCDFATGTVDTGTGDGEVLQLVEIAPGVWLIEYSAVAPTVINLWGPRLVWTLASDPTNYQPYLSSPSITVGSSGSYIANTTASPVTVTDYTRTGNTITLAQPHDATLDWDGDCRVVG